LDICRCESYSTVGGAPQSRLEARNSCSQMSTPIRRMRFGRPSPRRYGSWGSISSAASFAGRGGRTYGAGPESQPKSSLASPPNMLHPDPPMACILAVAYQDLDVQLRAQQHHP
ncbi:hypothetical protein NDU88_008137, partial [Pleurodeles waltl]